LNDRLDGDDDPDLLNELSELAIEDDEAPLNEPRNSGKSTPPVVTGSDPTNVIALLEERINMYVTAEQNAKAANDSTKARRLFFYDRFENEENSSIESIFQIRKRFENVERSIETSKIGENPKRRRHSSAREYGTT
jgi:hypothetical protein